MGLKRFADAQREAEKAVTHLNSMGITKIAMVYPDGSFGSDGLADAQKGMVTCKTHPRRRGEYLSLIGTDGKFKR